MFDESKYYSDLFSKIDEINMRYMFPGEKAKLYQKLNEIVKLDSALVTFRPVIAKEYLDLFRKRKKLVEDFYSMLYEFPIFEQVKNVEL